jgi:lipopolysaccharide export system protein LptA
MKRSEAARYARWSAGVALVLALVTAGVYLQRGWKARVERKNAPAAAAANVSRQSNGLNFSKVEGNRKVFTVEASKSTDFKDRDSTELEAVVITIFGKNGDRHDVIHTQSCQYGKTDGNVVCSGAVRMDLESAADAEKVDKSAKDGLAATIPQVMHVQTRAVSFNRASGMASTAEPVTFDFPNGGGDGVGMEYQSEAGTVKLLKDVHLRLRPPPTTAAPGKSKAPGKPQSLRKSKSPVLAPAEDSAEGGEEVLVTGSSLDFARAARLIHVQGPATAESKTTQLTSAELTMELDAQFRAQKLIASGNVNDQQPQMVSRGDAGTMQVNADRLTADFAPGGWVTAAEAQGAVKSVRLTDAERDDATSEDATVAMWPRVNQVRELNLRGNVALKSLANASGDSRTLHTTALRLAFSGGQENEQSRPMQAETLAPGRMEWTDSSGKSITGAPTPKAAGVSVTAKNKSNVANGAGGAEPVTVAHTTLSADKLQLAFDAVGKPKQLQADGHVQTERTMEGKPTQTATAQSGIAQLLPAGGWSQMDLNGNVKLREADRNGRSDHATFRRVEQTATLTGHAFVRDATTETAAARIVFVQNTGDIRAEGAVRSTDFSAHDSAVQLAPAPTHVTSDALQGNSQTGRALYTGHARLWQGESVLEADAIELLRETRVMNANGSIRAVFPQSPATPAAGAGPTVVQTSGAASPPSGPPASGPPASNKKSNLWHVTAQSLVYNDLENHAHLEHDVIAISQDQKMRAPIVDLYFTRGANEGPHGDGKTSAAPAGPQQISKAIGYGGVTVEEGGRKAVAEHGVYTASDGKFVMTGGTPTLYDGTDGTTVGRQLTFFLADDTIIVDSENGPRILTRHRVDKDR